MWSIFDPPQLLDRVFFQWRKATEALDYELNINLDPSVPPLPTSAGKTVAETWLFPSTDDITPPPSNIEHLTHIATLDPTLNAEQRVRTCCVSVTMQIVLTFVQTNSAPSKPFAGASTRSRSSSAARPEPARPRRWCAPCTSPQPA